MLLTSASERLQTNFKMTATLQETAPPLRFTRPLVGVWSVLAVTVLKTEDEVLAALEDGRLLWGFNIACHDSSKAMVRVLGQSVSDFIQGKSGQVVDFRPEIEQLIFPGYQEDELSAGVIARAWNCSSSHITNLCRAGDLQVSRLSPKRRTGAELMVDYSSAVTFLEKRRHF